MTPGAVTQRAARLAPELERELGTLGRATDTASLNLSTASVLRALYAAGLTLDADVGGGTVSIVRVALDKLELSSG